MKGLMKKYRIENTHLSREETKAPSLITITDIAELG